MTIPSTFPESLDQACQDFIRKECPKLPLSPSTITKYRYNLTGFLTFCREQAPPVLAPEQLTRELFEKYNEHLQGQAKEQKDTIKKRFTTLRALCRFLHQEGRIPEDFLLDFHPGLPPGPQAWQEPLPSPYWHHCQEFLRYCRSNRRLSDHTLRAYRNDLRCFSLYLEASGIQSPDIIDIRKETLEGYLDHGVDRLKKKTIRRHFACLMAFTSYLEYEELLEQNPFDRFRLKLRNPQRRHVSPHTFRHTFASLLLEEGADIKYIQEFLGHSSILTTQIYLHTSDEKKREILKTRHPRNKMDVPIINFFPKTIN